jgi:uncharacterized protein (DUF58 family)
VATPRRGVIRVGPIQARRTDPLTLLRWSERWSTSSELLVLPRMVPLEPLGGGVIRDQEGTPSDEISMNDLAFHALREYVPGDELRHVHWRSSAKADKLLIRQYHDTRRSHFTFVIDDDPDAYPAPEDFETAVSAAASMAARADGDGVDVSLLCGDHAVTGRGLDSVLDTCCRIELAAQAPPLPPVRGAREALQLAPETSWLVVLTGSAGSAGLAGALRAVLPPDITVLGVACDSGSRTGVSEVGGVRLVLLRGLDDLPRVLQVAAPAAQT